MKIVFMPFLKIAQKKKEIYPVLLVVICKMIIRKLRNSVQSFLYTVQN